jgi:7-cyano-7-deazaguanine synthase in queuosine biosynthesis
MTILVMLSGGVDSTAALIWALTASDEPVHVHHMHLINPEGRHQAEAEACRRIVVVCRQKYRDFQYSELTLDFSAMPWIPWDMLCVAFTAGLIVHKRPDIVRLVIGTCREEGHWRQRWDQFYRMVEGAAWPLRAPELLLPFLDRSKVEEIAYLPAEVRSMVWSCRRPVRTDTGFEACDHCKACRLTEVSCDVHEPPAEEAGI